MGNGCLKASEVAKVAAQIKPLVLNTDYLRRAFQRGTSDTLLWFSSQGIAFELLRSLTLSEEPKWVIMRNNRGDRRAERLLESRGYTARFRFPLLLLEKTNHRGGTDEKP